MVGKEKSDGHLEQCTRQIHRGNCFTNSRSVDVRNISAQFHKHRDKQETEHELAKREYPAEWKYSTGRFGILHGRESLHDTLPVGRLVVERTPSRGMGGGNILGVLRLALGRYSPSVGAQDGQGLKLIVYAARNGRSSTEHDA